MALKQLKDLKSRRETELFQELTDNQQAEARLQSADIGRLEMH